jgi:hypothetical protein
LADQYGPEVAAAAMAHSRAASTVDLAEMSAMPYSNTTTSTKRDASPDRQRYGAISAEVRDTSI